MRLTIPIAVVVIAVGFFYMEQHPRFRTFPLFNILRPDHYSFDEIPDLRGKVAIVTGGTAGLGRESVKRLYAKGAHVILTARTVEKGDGVRKQIEKEVGSSSSNGKIETMELELSSLKSVRRFAGAFLEKKLPLHILMLNAGVMATPYLLSEDGIEMQFAVNHVAHHLLTSLLLPKLQASAPSRIVSLSSAAHEHAAPHGVRLSLDQINDKASYSPFTNYGQSKLSNILFVKELNRRLKEEEKNGKSKGQVYVNAVHPGFVQTELTRYITDSGLVPGFLAPLIPVISSVVAYQPEKAVLTQLYPATSPEIEKSNISGEYFVPIAALERQLLHNKAEDMQLAKDLWVFTEKLIESKK